MLTDGIEGVYVETHNWGKTAKFLQELGFKVEFSTDHGSGMLRNGDGPYVFSEEVPEDHQPVEMQVLLRVADDDACNPGPPVEVVKPFEDTHYGTREMQVRDLMDAPGALQAPARP